jgi:hypothetical protein
MAGAVDDCCATAPIPTSRNPITAMKRLAQSIEPPWQADAPAGPKQIDSPAFFPYLYSPASYRFSPVSPPSYGFRKFKQFTDNPDAWSTAAHRQIESLAKQPSRTRNR